MARPRAPRRAGPAGARPGRRPRRGRRRGGVAHQEGQAGDRAQAGGEAGDAAGARARVPEQRAAAARRAQGAQVVHRHAARLVRARQQPPARQDLRARAPAGVSAAPARALAPCTRPRPRPPSRLGPRSYRACTLPPCNLPGRRPDAPPCGTRQQPPSGSCGAARLPRRRTRRQASVLRAPCTAASAAGGGAPRLQRRDQRGVVAQRGDRPAGGRRERVPERHVAARARAADRQHARAAAHVRDVHAAPPQCLRARAALNTASC